MAVSGLTAPQRSRTAHDHVAFAILSGELSGGTRLLQTKLAAELDLSTTPLREALRDLAMEGLVVFDPHRGAVVRTLDIDEVREIYELRITLEPIMVRRVAERITAEQFDRAEELAMKDAVRDGPVRLG